MVLGVPREAAGVFSLCARPASFAPGTGTPTEPEEGRGEGGAALGCGVRAWGTKRGQARAAAPAGSAGGGAGRREGKERRWEAPTPGQRRLPGNFVVKSKASEKEKRKPYPPPPARVSHAARRFCARGRLLCAAPLLPESAGQGWRRDAGGWRLGRTRCGRAAPAGCRGGCEESRRGCRCPGVLQRTASWPGPCA